MSSLVTIVWWKAALFRALRTAGVIATPYVPTVLYDNSWIIVGSAAGFGFVTSILTSLFGIPESDGTTVTWWFGLTERVVKTAAQALLTAFGTATMFEQVNWESVPAIVGTAVLGSLLLGVLKVLPESEIPLVQVAAPVVIVNEKGEQTEQEVPVVAVASAESSGGASAGSVS
jgi:hypothetical protein